MRRVLIGRRRYRAGSVSVPYLYLEVVDNSGVALDPDVTLAQNASIQLRADVKVSTGGVVATGVGATWTDNSSYFHTVTGTGLVECSPAALIGAVVTVSADFTYQGQALHGAATFRVVAGAAPDPGDVTMTKISGDNQTGPAGSILTTPQIVEIKDLGVPVGGALVTWVSPEGISVPQAGFLSDGNGRVDLGDLIVLGPVAGVQTLVVRNEFGNEVTFSHTATAVDSGVRTLELVSGGNQVGLVSTQVSADTVVRCRDGDGNVVVGAALIWTPVSVGSVAFASSATDGSGLGSCRVTLGTVAGTQVLRVSTPSGNGATLDVTFTAQSAPQPGNQVNIPSPLAASIIGPLAVVDSSNNFASVNPPWRTWMQRYLNATTGEPAIWTRYINQNEQSAQGWYVLDCQYGPGRLERTLSLGLPYGATETDESLTSTSIWAHTRRMLRHWLDAFAAVNNYQLNEQWMVTYRSLVAMNELEPTFEPTRTTNAIKVAAAMPTTDPFNYYHLTNPSGIARVIYNAMDAYRWAHMRGVPYASPVGINNQVAFDPTPGSWAAAAARQVQWLKTSSNYNWPSGTVPGFVHNNSDNNGASCFIDGPLAETMLLYDEHVQSDPDARQIAYDIVNRMVDFRDAILIPLGRQYHGYSEQNNTGTMSWADYNAQLIGTYLSPFAMVYQDTGRERIRETILELVAVWNTMSSSIQQAPMGQINAGKVFNETNHMGFYKAYAMIDKNIPWRT